MNCFSRFRSRLRVFSLCLLILIYAVDALAQQGWNHTLRARGAASYFDYDVDSQMGALYGLDMAVPLFQSVSGYGSFTHNHSAEGSQYLGTAGLFNQGNSYDGLLSSLSGGVLFDQYSDTRFDSLYLSQFRYFLGMALTENLGFGATYTNPIEDSDLATLVLPGGGTATATFRNAEMVEGFVSLKLDRTLITGVVGQRQDPNDMIAALHVAHELSPNLSLYSMTSYGDPSLLTGTVGLKWVFGPGARSGYARSGRFADSLLDDSTIVRAQSPSGAGSPFDDPSLGHNLELDPQRFGSLVTNDSAGAPTLIVTGGGGPEEEGGYSMGDVFRLDPTDIDELAVTRKRAGGTDNDTIR